MPKSWWRSAPLPAGGAEEGLHEAGSACTMVSDRRWARPWGPSGDCRPLGRTLAFTLSESGGFAGFGEECHDLSYILTEALLSSGTW